MTPWDSIQHESLADEAQLVDQNLAKAALAPPARAAISAHGAELVTQIRGSAKPGLMEVFLAEYGLSTDEGIALMCLAEALLRVPDAPTMDALIEDKIAPADWGRHLGRSASRVRIHNQNKTTAANAQADRKTLGHRSYRVATLRQSLSRAKLFSILWRFR